MFVATFTTWHSLEVSWPLLECMNSQRLFATRWSATPPPWETIWALIINAISLMILELFKHSFSVHFPVVLWNTHGPRSGCWHSIAGQSLSVLPCFTEFASSYDLSYLHVQVRHGLLPLLFEPTKVYIIPLAMKAGSPSLFTWSSKVFHIFHTAITPYPVMVTFVQSQRLRRELDN